jgi:hypothetical protein
MPPKNDGLTWEEVLANVEAEVERAETLLEDESPDYFALAGTVPPFVLPSLRTMPPVPAGLEARIRALRDRVEEVQGLLSTALSAGTAPVRVGPRMAPHLIASAPRFVDRRV